MLRAMSCVFSYGKLLEVSLAWKDRHSSKHRRVVLVLTHKERLNAAIMFT